MYCKSVLTNKLLYLKKKKKKKKKENTGTGGFWPVLIVFVKA